MISIQNLGFELLEYHIPQIQLTWAGIKKIQD